MMRLPRFIVLKSNYNNKYLRYLNEDHEAMHGYMEFSGDEVVSPFSKFEVVRSKHQNGLVHIKCCYNNKYWVSKSEEGDRGIVAGADKQHEKKCPTSGSTVFEPVHVDGNDNMVRFRYDPHGNYICLWKQDDAPWASILASGISKTADRELMDVFTITDWESLLILPKHVAFKGDNGEYLGVMWAHGHPFLQYGFNDVATPSAENEIFTNSDGHIRIRNKQCGKFWRLSPCWIWADSDESSSYHPDSLFRPIKIGKNVIALRLMEGTHFCKRLTCDGFTNCLNACIPTITNEAHIEVEELVMSRSVYDVNFHLLDSSVYDETIVTMATGDAINKTQTANYMDVELSYKESRAWYWDASFSLKLGIKMNFRAGIPIIAEGKAKISADFTGEYEWGKSQSLEKDLTVTHRATVLPNSRLKVKLVATKGSCDIPFSYSYSDTLTNGERVVYDRDDGICTGVNCYNFQFETETVPL